MNNFHQDNLLKDSKRECWSMDQRWRFHRGDIPLPFPRNHGDTVGRAKPGVATGPASPEFDDSSWQTVDVPHDWAVEGPFNRENNLDHGFLPKEVGWYRKNFILPDSDRGRCLRLEFDGVFRNCTVWLNSNRLMKHESGYSVFSVDITDVANYGGENSLVVKVDALDFEGWWYEGSGIYRHVRLLKTSVLHIVEYGTWIKAEPDDEFQYATIDIQTEIINEGDVRRDFHLKIEILNPDGCLISGDQISGQLLDGQQEVFRQTVKIGNPMPWSVTSPSLYQVVTSIYQGDCCQDRSLTSFGIRTCRFDSKTGFFLNGESLKIKGVCIHQDFAGVGVAVPERIHEFRLQRLKEMGCNAVRIHHPASSEFLDLCDRMGILLVAEHREISSSLMSVSILENMVRHGRNHPCIFLWSLGNEDTNYSLQVGARIVSTLMRRVRRLDPLRPITIAQSGCWWSDVVDQLDLTGFNYHIDKYDKYHEEHPDKPVLATETASTLSTRAVYISRPEQCLLSSYDVNNPPWGATAEVAWKAVAERAYLAGAFVWTGYDYRGEPTPFDWPCIASHFGIMDLCGFPKDNYWYYKSWWTNEPVLHLFPHWNWPDRMNQEIEVWCHGNCEEIELFLNGKSLGRKQMMPLGHLVWHVPYCPGKLVAEGFRGGKQIIQAEVETTGAPAAIRLVPYRSQIHADGTDVALVTAQVIDDAGRVIPDAENEICFELLEPYGAKIIGVGNGNPISHEADKASSRRAWGGLCLVIVQAGFIPGEILMRATASGLKAGSCRLIAEKSEVVPYVPSLLTDKRISHWWLSPVLSDEPGVDYVPKDYDVNTWQPVFVNGDDEGTFPAGGWAMYFAKAQTPAYNPDFERVYLRFHGIRLKAKVYINRQLIAECPITDTTYDVPLDNVGPGVPFTVAVSVYCASGRGFPLRGGLYKPVAIKRVSRG